MRPYLFGALAGVALVATIVWYVSSLVPICAGMMGPC